MANVGERGRLDVLCVGAGTLVDHALGGSASVCSVALLCSNTPMLLVGAGPGSLRQSLHHLGGLPPAVFLPSAQALYTADLQAMMQYEASYGRKLRIYAAGDVLDQTIAGIDEDIVVDVRSYVEFLQVELGAPTSFHGQYFLMTQRCDTKNPRYNMVVLDTFQKPLIAFIDGPLSYQSVFQQSPCAIVRAYKGFVAEQLHQELGMTKLLVMGCPPDVHLAAPAAALRPGDAFVAPLVKGGTSTAPPSRSMGPYGLEPSAAAEGEYSQGTGEDSGLGLQYLPAGGLRSALRGRSPPRGGSSNSGRRQGWNPSTTPSNNNSDSVYVTNHGEPRFNMPYDDAPQQPSSSSYQGQYAAPYPGAEPGSNPHRRQWNANPRSSRGASPAAGYRPSTPSRVGLSEATAKVAARGHGPPAPPRKLYIFNNEVKEAEPVIVMLHEHMTLPALKAKIGGLLNIRPFGQLYTIDGGIVRDAAHLAHCQEVVATKHAGAPFDLGRLPFGMQFTRPAAPADQVMAFM